MLKLAQKAGHVMNWCVLKQWCPSSQDSKKILLNHQFTSHPIEKHLIIVNYVIRLEREAGCILNIKLKY